MTQEEQDALLDDAADLCRLTSAIHGELMKPEPRVLRVHDHVAKLREELMRFAIKIGFRDI
jgi:hypothetical protein